MTNASSSCSRRESRRPRGRAFTLVEVVASLAILSILVLAMGSAVVLAMRALPRADDPAALIVEDSRVVDQIAAELTYATGVNSITPTEIEFTMERGATTSTIKYSWSGTVGDALVRSVNGSPKPVAFDVQSFGVDYDAIELSPPSSPPTVEGPEQLFVQQDENTMNGTPDVFGIANNARCGQSFLPAMPADAVSWKITRAQFIGAPAGNPNGMLAISVTGASGNGKPSGSVIDQVTVPETSLVAGAWHEIVFAAAGDLGPSKEHFITFERASGGGTTAEITIHTGVTNTPDTTYFEDSGGGTWSETTDRDIRLWVWGTISTPDPGWTPPPPDEEVYRVKLALRTGVNSTTDALTSVLLLNRPVVMGGP